MAGGGDNTITIIAIGAVGFAALYSFVPEFKKGVQGLFSGFGNGGTGTCEDLCKRRECSTYLSRCGTTGCPSCNQCSKLCAAAQCASYKTAGCKGICNNCGAPPSQQVSSNCRYVTDPKNGAKYTIWKGTGCSGGYLRNGLEAAVAGNNCSAARAAFVKAYTCPAKYAHVDAYAASPYQNVTVA